MSYIAVIGAGSWGTTLAALLAEKEYDVSLWAFEKDLVETINMTGVNTVYLPGSRLPANLKVTSDIEEAVNKSRYILNVVPTQFTRAVFKEAVQYLSEDAVIISASKGIEQGTLLTVSSILKEITGHQTAVLSGPSFAKEVINKLPDSGYVGYGKS